MVAVVIIILGSATSLSADSPSTRTSFTYRVESGTALLNGPWERYTGNLPEETLDSSKASIVELALKPKAPERDALSGPFTYRIRICYEGGAPARRMALYVPAIAGVRAVYADGRLLYDADRDPTTPPLLLIDAPGDETSLLLHVGQGSPGLEAASFYPPFVLFGDAESLSRTRLLYGLSAASLDAYFILIGLFVFILFLFWKKNGDFLAFSAYMLVAGLSYFFKDGALFLYLGAERMPLEQGYLVSLALQYLALTYLLHSVYKSRIKTGPAIAAYALPAALAAAALAFPGLIAEIDSAATAYCALFSIAAVAGAIALAAKGDKKARWLIPAFLVMPAGLAWRSLGTTQVWSAYLAAPLGVAVFGLLAMLMLIKKVADTFESAESLTGYVADVTRSVKRFIPKEFLDNLEKKDFVDLRLGDHAKKEMTIFFSDIRAFTELSEKLTVEENFAFINSYLSRVVPIIKENGGFVDKYVGDGIMALFPGPRGPDEAIRSAIAMQAKMVEYNGHRAKMGYRPISMGVGIHTGDLMLGVVGVEDRMENTVISDAVNLSSRLQSITKAFNISLAISEQSFKELEDPGSYMYRFIGKVKVKGKAEPVSVFEIFDGIESELFERKMKANMFFEQGMLTYYQKDFSGAMFFFKKVLEILPEDGAASFYFDNCMNKANL